MTKLETTGEAPSNDLRQEFRKSFTTPGVYTTDSPEVTQAILYPQAIATGGATELSQQYLGSAKRRFRCRNGDEIKSAETKRD